jgi:hypothetical protein
MGRQVEPDYRSCVELLAAAWTGDRLYLGSLIASTIVVSSFLMLAHAQPAPFIDEDHRRAVLAKLLQFEPVPTEPISRLRSETTRSLETGLAHPAPPRSLPRLPEPSEQASTRERPRWAPASPMQAVGRFERGYDPIDAARHAGILGVLGDRRLDHERVFDPDVDDARLWAATTSEIVPIGPGSFGDFSYTMATEGVIGWGSYGNIHIGDWRGRTEANTDAAFCPDCRAHGRLPRPIVTIVRLGRVDVQGGVDPDVARRIIRAHVNDLRRCYDRTLTESVEKLEGTFEFSVIQGKVGSIVMGPEFSDERAGCMKRVMRTWRFPVGPGHETSMVSVSLRFSR